MLIALRMRGSKANRENAVAVDTLVITEVRAKIIEAALVAVLRPSRYSPYTFQRKPSRILVARMMLLSKTYSSLLIAQ